MIGSQIWVQTETSPFWTKSFCFKVKFKQTEMSRLIPPLFISVCIYALHVILTGTELQILQPQTVAAPL